MSITLTSSTYRDVRLVRFEENLASLHHSRTFRGSSRPGNQPTAFRTSKSRPLRLKFECKSLNLFSVMDLKTPTVILLRDHIYRMIKFTLNRIMS